MEASRLTDMSLDHIKQYRDKSQCSKFQSEFESYCAKLEEYVQKLNHLKKERKSLVQLMEQSEIFYDAQFKDAKMVFNVSLKKNLRGIRHFYIKYYRFEGC